MRHIAYLFLPLLIKLVCLVTMSNDSYNDVSLDATGLKCPLPVLKARRQIAAMNSGDILMVRADDPAAPLDFAHFCEVGGHTLMEQSEDDHGVISFRIRKA